MSLIDLDPTQGVNKVCMGKDEELKRHRQKLKQNAFGNTELVKQNYAQRLEKK